MEGDVRKFSNLEHFKDTSTPRTTDLDNEVGTEQTKDHAIDKVATRSGSSQDLSLPDRLIYKSNSMSHSSREDVITVKYLPMSKDSLDRSPGQTELPVDANVCPPTNHQVSPDTSNISSPQVTIAQDSSNVSIIFSTIQKELLELYNSFSYQ